MNEYLQWRSLMLTLPLDERKWAKTPSIPFDIAILNMEATVPPHLKVEGRAAVVRALADESFLGGRPMFAGPNALSTPWGEEDMKALARAGVTRMMIPKVTSVADIDDVVRLLAEHGAEPDLIPIIETPGGVANVDAIAAHPRVKALSFGEGDLSAALGTEIYEPNGDVNPGLFYSRMRVVIAGATHEKATYDAAFVHDIKNLDEFRARAEASARLGFTGMDAIYPPYIEIINKAFSPSPDEIAHARSVLDAYAAAQAEGNPAVHLEDGTVLMLHDQMKAEKILARAR